MVEDSLRAIDQASASPLGAEDPRMDAHRNIDYCLQRQIRGYSRLDPLPNQVNLS
jgi:hypothetical protein